MWNAAIRAIIDLLKIRKDVQKTDLEIDKLKRDEKEATKLIQLASLDEVKKYDPKTAANIRIADRLQHERWHVEHDYMSQQVLRSARRSYSRVFGCFITLLIVVVVSVVVWFILRHS